MPALRPAQRVPHGLGLRSVSKEIKRLFGFGFVFFFFSDSTPTQSTGYRRGRAKRRHGNKGGWVCAPSRFCAAQPKDLIAPPPPPPGEQGSHQHGRGLRRARGGGSGGLLGRPAWRSRAAPCGAGAVGRRWGVAPPGGPGAVPGPRRLGGCRLAGGALSGALASGYFSHLSVIWLAFSPLRTIITAWGLALLATAPGGATGRAVSRGWPAWGCAMLASSSTSRFVSVPASFSGRVVLRAHRSGSVWAWRAVRRGDRPSPACLFLPAPSRGLALRWAACARFLGWSASVRVGVGCAVWRSGPLAAAAPAWACKVLLPADTSAAAGRAALARADRALALQGA